MARYTHMTFENIIANMLNDVELKYPDLDTREGSIIYDALAPYAEQLAQLYIQLDAVLDLGFADTSEGEWLEKRTQELGVKKITATKAVRRGTFNIPVGVGERFFIDNLHYVVIEGGISATLQCETYGSIGNEPIGTLLPINNIDGLTSAVLGDILIPGIDDEGGPSLFERYQSRVTNAITTGAANKHLYKKWAEEDIAGVGAAKVFPLWNGDNTVKIVIVDTTMAPASQTLVNEVQEYIDPGGRGLGEGVDGIGNFVTVVSASALTINISVTLVLTTGTTVNDAVLSITEAINAYFRTIAFKDDSTIVRYNEIGNIIFNSQGVIDYSNLLINNGSTNIQLTAEQIPTLGEVVASV